LFDQALSVGIFPYVLKLLQTTATDLRQILVFIWTKILALDKVPFSLGFNDVWLEGGFVWKVLLAYKVLMSCFKQVPPN